MIGTLNVRDDFRRDGLAASFRVDKNLFRIYMNAYPDGTRFNIGYPSICSEEYNSCSRILELAEEKDTVELCVVGHARHSDLQMMSRLLEGRKNVSANVWIPVSEAATRNILGKNTADTLEIAERSIAYWRDRTNQPLDIALTDITCNEKGIDERVVTWYHKLKLLGYRSIILCDTKGIGDETRLRNIFKQVNDFEWHPHNDNLNAFQTSEISASYGVTHIGSSYLGFSERMNMLDPRTLIGDRMNLTELDNFYSALASLLGEDPLAVAHEIYNKQTAITGTHFKLWNYTGVKKLYFGVTSDTSLYTMITGLPISAKELATLKDIYFYQMKLKYLTQEQLRNYAIKIS